MAPRDSAAERLGLHPDRGMKRRCSACGTPFYDLRRTPIVCPKCGATHVPATWASRKRAAPTPTGRDPEVVAAEAREAEDKAGQEADEDDDEGDRDEVEGDEVDGEVVDRADVDEADEDETTAEPAADATDDDDATPGRGALD